MGGRGGRGEGRGGGGEGDGGGWVVEKAPCASHDPPAPVPAAPRRPLSPIPPPCPPLLPLLPGWPPASQGGCPKGQKGAFWAPKPLFGPKNDFWRQKCILVRKTENWLQKRKKNEKMELKTPKKPLSRARFAQGCENDPKRCPKTQKTVFCAQNRFLSSKSLFEQKVRK